MSAKWVRSQQWDDQFFPSWAAPAKFVLRAFSSVWLAICLLSLVAIYGTLASVPIGMLAGIPTWLVYVGSLLVAVVLIAVLPCLWMTRALTRRGFSPAKRFVFTFTAFLFATAIAWTLWYTLLWPVLYFDPLTGSGLKLFPAFCETYKRTMLRHLPMMEMSEMEFYSWWPLRIVLFAFVINLATATIRRIEFKFMYIGVLTVHTGIITIAIGSMYYGALKQEGDTFLFAGRPDDTGSPTIGRSVRGFFYNPEQVDPALWVTQPARGSDWEQRPIPALPRYNDYGLDAAAPSIGDLRSVSDEGRTLSIPVPRPTTRELIDDDIRFRVVGYAAYGETADVWVDAAGMGGSALVRHIELISTMPDRSGKPRPLGGKFHDLSLAPNVPAARLATLERAITVEYLEGAKPEYWAALQTQTPPDARHALVIELPATGSRQVFAVEPGKTLDLGGGWQVVVKELHPEPPISIITPGYEGATSSVAIVRVQPPKQQDGQPAVAFDRYVYSRFPELNQDLLDDRTSSGMPKRRGADDSIRLTYIDASTLSVVIDGGSEGRTPRAIVRFPPRETVTKEGLRGPLGGGRVTVIDSLKEGEPLQLIPVISLRLGKRFAQAELIEAPWPTPDEARDRDLLRTRRASQVAVEVSTVDKAGATTWSTILWLINNPWHTIQTDNDLFKEVPLPDGRMISLAYGRRYQPFPGFEIALRDFEMTPYPHTMTPKDYRSDLVVTRHIPGAPVSQEQHSTSMNNPLLLGVPYQPHPDANRIARFAGYLVSFIAPNQYKLSQNSWDPEGWRRTKAMADRGELPRPLARFTIIGVGNNPGIYIIATGGVLMALGIPWAFYVKPWLLRRQKARIQAELAAKGLLKKSAPPAEQGSGNGLHVQTPSPHVPHAAPARSES